RIDAAARLEAGRRHDDLAGVALNDIYSVQQQRHVAGRHDREFEQRRVARRNELDVLEVVGRVRTDSGDAGKIRDLFARQIYDKSEARTGGGGAGIVVELKPVV